MDLLFLPLDETSVNALTVTVTLFPGYYSNTDGIESTMAHIIGHGEIPCFWHMAHII